jgi:molecular chaperone GrpE
MVVQVVQAGYMLGDRVLRPAMVGVSKGGPKPAPKAAVSEETDAED